MRLAGFVFLFVCAMLAPAAAGDFGRPKPSIFEGLFPKQYWKGLVEQQSNFPLTDIEVELRDRSYALIRPNEPRGKWNFYIAGFEIAHLFPPSIKYDDHTEYARMLLATLSRSEASSYNRLMEDMAADAILIRAFVPVACTVWDLDVKRERSLAYVGELSGAEIENAFGRIRENRMVTAWVRRAAHWRLASYRYALERFVIMMPSPRAIDAERALKRFEQVVWEADKPLAQCGAEVFVAAAGRPVVSK